MSTLFIIPARGGSKGIPGKNIKPLNGIPLIHYSIDLARRFAEDKDICVSTDSEQIREVVNAAGLEVPFLRPAHLAADETPTYDVLLHALQYYESKRIFYQKIVLLQPTSPLRKPEHVKECLELYNDTLDMVVSVEALPDPSYLCYREDQEGLLRRISEDSFSRRQDVPLVYKFNGAVYVMKVNSLKKNTIADFTRVKKYVMDATSSVDIDNQLDWEIAELILTKKYTR